MTSQLGIVTEYSTRGQLLGHLVMGAQEVSEVCRELGIPEEKSVLLQHMLLLASLPAVLRQAGCEVNHVSYCKTDS